MQHSHLLRADDVKPFLNVMNGQKFVVAWEISLSGYVMKGLIADRFWYPAASNGPRFVFCTACKDNCQASSNQNLPAELLPRCKTNCL